MWGSSPEPSCCVRGGGLGHKQQATSCLSRSVLSAGLRGGLLPASAGLAQLAGSGKAMGREPERCRLAARHGGAAPQARAV